MVFQKFVSEKSEMNYWFIIHDTKEISEKILKFQRCVPSQSPTNHPIHRTLVYQCLRTEKKTGHFKWKFAIYWTISNYDISVCTQFDLEGFEFIIINVGLELLRDCHWRYSLNVFVIAIVFAFVFLVVFLFARLCFPITLIKYLKGQNTQRSLFEGFL